MTRRLTKSKSETAAPALARTETKSIFILSEMSPIFLPCAVVVGALVGTAVGFTPSSSFRHPYAYALRLRTLPTVHHGIPTEGEHAKAYTSESTASAPSTASTASRNFPDDERYRKNRRLYTQLKASSPVRQDLSRRQRNNSKPKVLAPAGGWPQLEAAIAAGADAVYFG